MTRAEQETVLASVVLAYNSELGRLYGRPYPAYKDTLSSFRASLRLDDPGLEAIIAEHEASGRPWPAWSREAVRV